MQQKKTLSTEMTEAQRKIRRIWAKLDQVGIEILEMVLEAKRAEKAEASAASGSRAP